MSPRFLAGVFALLFLLVPGRGAAQAKVFIASELGPSLAARIAAELGTAIVSAREDAELVLTVEESPEELHLELVARDGGQVLSRAFRVEENRTAAERLLVLALVEALRKPVSVPPAASKEEARTSTIAPRTPDPRPDRREPEPVPDFEPEWAIGIGGAAQLATWGRSATPQLGGELAVSFVTGLFAFGIAAGAVGGAPPVSTVGSGGEREIEIRQVAVYLLATAHLRILDFSGFRTGPELALGAAILNLEARPVAYVGEEIPTRQTHGLAIARAGWTLTSPAVALTLRLRLSVGLEVRPWEVTFRLPPQVFETLTDPLQTGHFAPYLLLGAVGEVF